MGYPLSIPIFAQEQSISFPIGAIALLYSLELIGTYFEAE